MAAHLKFIIICLSRRVIGDEGEDRIIPYDMCDFSYTDILIYRLLNITTTTEEPTRQSLETYGLILRNSVPRN